MSVFENLDDLLTENPFQDQNVMLTLKDIERIREWRDNSDALDKFLTSRSVYPRGCDGDPDLYVATLKWHEDTDPLEAIEALKEVKSE